MIKICRAESFVASGTGNEILIVFKLPEIDLDRP